MPESGGKKAESKGWVIPSPFSYYIEDESIKADPCVRNLDIFLYVLLLCGMAYYALALQIQYEERPIVETFVSMSYEDFPLTYQGTTLNLLDVLPTVYVSFQNFNALLSSTGGTDDIYEGTFLQYYSSNVENSECTFIHIHTST